MQRNSFNLSSIAETCLNRNRDFKIRKFRVNCFSKLKLIAVDFLTRSKKFGGLIN